MKKILLTLLLIPTLAGAAQQEITAVPDSPVLPSIGALKDAVNLRLADIDENFDELYPIIEAGPVYVNASAPADTKVVWIDTDQDNAIKINISGTWTVVGTTGEGSYTLPTAAADTLGGVKVGDRLTIADGVLSADVQTTDISGKQDTLVSGTNIKTINSTSLLGSGDITIEGSGDDLGSAAYSDVVALWTTCTGYLKSDGTCDTPSGSATYPSAAGVANWNGSAWGTSYTVGAGASNLVQLNASAQLPAVSADLLTITDTGTYFTTDTVGAALQELGSELADVTEITLDSSLTETGGVLSVTNPVTSEVWSGSGWNGDTEGLTRNDAYDYLHIADTDDDGLPNKVDLATAGIVKTDASGVIATATPGTDYLLPTGAGGSLTVTATGFDGQLATTDDTLQEIAQKFDDLTVPSAGIGGSTGSTDNAVLRANGTGGSTAQASGVTIDDSDNVTTTGVLAGKMATVVNSDTASYNVTTAQARAGTLFLTTNTATTTYTLPAAEAGMTACFSMGQGNSQILRIDTDGTDFIVMSTRARTSVAGDYYGATASATNKVCVAAYDATDWYVESEVGTWTEE